MRLTTRPTALLLVAVLVPALAACSQSSSSTTLVPAQPTRSLARPHQPVSAPTQAPAGSLPDLPNKPAPVVRTFAGCPPTGWAFSRISPLVDHRTRVRISGWLMLDQEHPDQVGKTRGTIWEIHPVIALDVDRDGTWVSLDTGRAVSAPSLAAAGTPTPDTLPPPKVEPTDATHPAIPTPTATKARNARSAIAHHPRPLA